MNFSLGKAIFLLFFGAPCGLRDHFSCLSVAQVCKYKELSSFLLGHWVGTCLPLIELKGLGTSPKKGSGLQRK